MYFDFDAFEEMQISTGGADVTMQSPGVGVNLVTKSGTDKFRGSARFYVTDEKFQSINVTDDLRKQGATSGNPIQNIKDYGVEVGGPIKKGRAWVWGSYGKQNINVGINNFYKPDADCQAMKADLAANPLSHPIEDVWALPEHRPTTSTTTTCKLARGAVQEQPVLVLLQRGREGPQRARRVGPAPDRDDLPPDGRDAGRASARAGGRPACRRPTSGATATSSATAS